MANNYHSYEEVETKARNELPRLIDELEETIQEFITYKNNIQELLEALHTCLNTSGGVDRLKNLANINTGLDITFLTAMIENNKDVIVDYKTVEKYIGDYRK